MSAQVVSDNCPTCKGAHWVCENHPDKPWSKAGCECGAGMPCPTCGGDFGHICDECDRPCGKCGPKCRECGYGQHWHGVNCSQYVEISRVPLPYWRNKP